MERHTEGALVDVQVASGASVTWGTRADRFAVDRVRVTVGAFLTRVADASVVKVTQQTCGYHRKSRHQVLSLHFIV